MFQKSGECAGKIIVFKTLAMSKIVFLSLISKVTTEIISELERKQKTFLWPWKPKIKNETLCSDFKHVGLENIDIQEKNDTPSMLLGEKVAWPFFHEWKVIPLKREKSIGSHFKFALIFYSVSLVVLICHVITKTFCLTGKYIFLNHYTNSIIDSVPTFVD